MDIKDIYGLSILILLFFDDPKKILQKKINYTGRDKKLINN
jgi:hypothetical protein